MDGVYLADVGLEDDGGHGLGPLDRVLERLENAEDVLDAEEPVGVLESLGLVGREERRQLTLGCAFSPLVLACCASIARPSLQRHQSVYPP